jgi:hypothetical protein
VISAGHGVSEGGIVLDLSLLKALELEPAQRVAWAQTGPTSGELTPQPTTVSAVALALPAVSVSSYVPGGTCAGKVNSSSKESVLPAGRMSG